MTYKIVKNKKENNFCVIELATDKIMFVSKDHDEAHKVYRSFIEGNGFEGWTPDFVEKRIYTN